MPKTLSQDLTLMFSLFSDNIAAKIEVLDEGAFKISDKTSDNGNEIIEVFFFENDMSYNISYDKYSGVPISFDAGNDEISVSIILSDFKINTNK